MLQSSTAGAPDGAAPPDAPPPHPPQHAALDAFVRAMPKAELHVHLEGAVRPETLLALARRHGVPLPAASAEELRAWYAFRDFPHFAEVFTAISGCLRTPDDLELVAREFLAGQAAQQVRYTEVTLTPQAHARPRPGGGPERFRAAFRRAADAGLPRVPHAGETEGAASIWGALDVLGADRIGHGVRCLEDPALVEALRARGTPLEVCPTSNVRLGVAPSLAAHPLPRLVAAGLVVTVNSDDPPLFGTTLTDEYRALHRVFGMDRGQIEALALAAVRASFLPPAAKAATDAAFRAAYTALAGVPTPRA